jgi:hypothetical protein
VAESEAQAAQELKLVELEQLTLVEVRAVQETGRSQVKTVVQGLLYYVMQIPLQI